MRAHPSLFRPSPAVALASVLLIALLAACGGGTDQPADGNFPVQAPASDDQRVSRMEVSAAAACAAPANPVVAENCLAGTPSSEWDVAGNGDPSIQGYAVDISFNRGQTAAFKINTNARGYSIAIYRIGYYGGAGARRVATVVPSATLPQTQPPCLSDTSTGLVDCGNWAVSATWSIPANAVSGVYVAKLTRPDTGGSSHIKFVVRDDASRSDLLFQTSDTTWQAYNTYGGNSLYTGSPAAWGAYKVSYNRPLQERGDPWHAFFVNEYPMVRWLEANGYDVSYTTGIDSDRRGALIRNHKVFLSVGHDEYWSGAQRANVEAARDAGVHLAFFSGNSIYWKTRWESSIDGSNTPNRTLVVYKETRANAKIDPSPTWTGTWRDPRFSPPSDGGRPENALQGTFWLVNCCTDSSTADYTIQVPAEEGRMRLWRNTGLQNQASGQVTSLVPGLLGFEWDTDVDNGFRPAGLVRLSRATYNVPEMLVDFGSTVAPGTVTHYLTLYRHASGALVFGAGTTRWSWGLDASHDGAGPPADPRVQQATVNLFADMGAQPYSMQPGLIAASASLDSVPPVVNIAAPANGTSVSAGTTVTLSGTAADTGGVVAGVEVSANGGLTWSAATGRGNWSFAWVAPTEGLFTVQVRAIDDSGNIQSAPAQVSINVTPRVCPCSIFTPSMAPAVSSLNDPSSVEVGVKFTVTRPGYVTGIRFFKGTGNGGTHTGSLWTATGQLLSRVTFTGETASGWQQARFERPVFVNSNTTYVASYFAPQGRYSATSDYFIAARDMSPIRVPSAAEAGGNGVYSYGTTTRFPTETFGAPNYWVDVVFETSLPPGVVVAGNDAYTVFRNQPLTVPAPGVFANDLPEAIGAPLTLALVAPPARGTLALSPDGGFVYTPNNGYIGNDSFTYRATSGSGASATAVVALNVLNAGTVFASTAVPAVASANDVSALELGMKFRASASGRAIGARFFKGPNNPGPHIVNLWSLSGQLLARANPAPNSSTGWQEVMFPVPAPLAAGTTYVVSYFTPSGGYAFTPAFFASAVSGGFLTAPSSGESGGNGIYRYGATTGFPAESFNASNYWVDVIFESDVLPGQVTAAADAYTVFRGETLGVAAPGVLANDSVAGVQTAPAASLVSGPLNGSLTLNPDGSFSYQPNAGFTGTDSFTYRATSSLGLTADASATISVGNTTTLFAATAVPAVPAVADPSAVEVGMKFSSRLPGFITAIRFYKGPGNNGPHVGNLWSASGELLASATFTAETASGWQQVELATPVPVAADTLYVVSYFAPVGNYAATPGFFNSGVTGTVLSGPAGAAVGGNGVYRYSGVSAFPTNSFNNANYWVDVVLTAP